MRLTAFPDGQFFSTGGSGRVARRFSLKFYLHLSDCTPPFHSMDDHRNRAHRIIRKRGSSGRLSVVTTTPEKARTFARRLIEVWAGPRVAMPVRHAGSAGAGIITASLRGGIQLRCGPSST